MYIPKKEVRGCDDIVSLGQGQGQDWGQIRIGKGKERDEGEKVPHIHDVICTHVLA